MNVYPAAGLINYARPGTPVYLIDPNEVIVAGHSGITLIRKGAAQGVDELRKLITDE